MYCIFFPYIIWSSTQHPGNSQNSRTLDKQRLKVVTLDGTSLLSFIPSMVSAYDRWRRGRHQPVVPWVFFNARAWDSVYTAPSQKTLSWRALKPPSAPEALDFICKICRGSFAAPRMPDWQGCGALCQALVSPWSS